MPVTASSSDGGATPACKGAHSFLGGVSRGARLYIALGISLLAADQIHVDLAWAVRARRHVAG
jgi:hypothetical protein